ncbi:MAG: exodeoxyribonuclease VII large subunit [Erysipelotrichaceae bacterium]
MKQVVYSVSTLVHYIKQSLDNDMNIQSILIKGEISNFTNHRSGHWYFTLKDSKAKISCVMFSSHANRCPLVLKEGMKVIITASVSMYEASGSIQLYVTKVQVDGLGDLYLQFEQLKEKLLKEGLFDSSLKKAIPIYPERIVIITAKEGAAIQDMLTTIATRWPIAEVTFYPSLVQGNLAAKNLVECLIKADQENHDVILLARGGGAIEDLWCFNDETLARTIVSLKTPLISGVGHESDTTLVDYVSDKRAATPTAAAQSATPNIEEVRLSLFETKRKMKRIVDESLKHASQQYRFVKDYRYFKDPMSFIETKQMKLAMVVKELSKVEYRMQQYAYDLKKVSQSLLNQGSNISLLSQQNLILKKHQLLETIDQMKQNNKLTLQHQIELLDAYSPLKILKRGYSITKKADRIIKNIDDINEKDTIITLLENGRIYSVVSKKEKTYERR